MTTLYLDIFSGISGDMFLGAMIDLGLDPRALERELEKLGLAGWQLHVARGKKANIDGVKFEVRLSREHSPAHAPAEGTAQRHAHGDTSLHHHEHEIPVQNRGGHAGLLVETSQGQVELSVFETGVPPRFRLYFHNAKGKVTAPAAANKVTLETIRPGRKRQLFRFKRRNTYLEATEELPEPHEFTAILRLKRGSREEKHERQFIEDHHHGHAHAHEGEHRGEARSHAHGRNFSEIQELVRRSGLSDWVKQNSVAVFHRIAVAEGKIHGLPPEHVHFHEVGAIDSIVDIVGACVALEMLGRPRVLAAPVVEGTGFIDCAHGRFPLPAPATLAILGARGVGITQCEEPQELVTPTGAALLAEFADRFAPMQNLVATKIGYGLGSRDNKTRPNVLRAILGDVRESQTSGSPTVAHDWETDTVAVIETNLDDINAEILGHFVEKAFVEGALDVFHTPIQMKKNRPGVLLTVLCALADADRFCELMLRETSAFGVRRYSAERRKLERELVKVKTEFGDVAVKLGKLDGKVVQAAPEFESCKKLAAQSGTPLKRIYEEAISQIRMTNDRS
jgi:pyridinium-3,5-bisthiocarboxylic acid mononucleotide nickel chelatase